MSEYDTLRPKAVEKTTPGPATAKKTTPGPATAKKTTPGAVAAKNPRGINLSPPSGKPQTVARAKPQGSAESAREANSRSGYADKVQPDSSGREQSTALPPASGRFSSKRPGRLTPAEKLERGMYKPGVTPVLTTEEVSRRASKRAQGKIPLIDELNSNEGIGAEGEAMESQRNNDGEQAQDFDPLGGEENLEPGSPELVKEEKALADQRGSARPRVPDENRQTTGGGIKAAVSQADTYLEQRCRITLEMDSGSMTVPAIGAVPSKYGVTILLPSDDNSATFIPKPGSEITIVAGDKSWPCYFPGISFDVPELGVIGLSFVRKEED